MELIFTIESASIESGVIIPSQRAFGSSSFFECSMVDLTLADFQNFSFKHVVLESSPTSQHLRVKLAFLGLTTVIIEISIIVRPVGKDIGSFALGFPIFEVSDVEIVILFVHLSEAFRI